MHPQNSEKRPLPLSATNLALGFIIFLSAIFVIAFSILNIQKFRTFNVGCFSIGFYEYAYHKMITLGRFEISFLPKYIVNCNIIAHPINFLFVAYYAIFRRPEALLISQTIIMASGTIPLFFLVKKLLRNNVLAVTLSTSYLFHPIVNMGAAIGFSPCALSLPLLLAAFYYLEQNSAKKFWIAVILANMSKIDVILMNLLWGGVLVTTKRNSKYGKRLLYVSLGWLLIVSASIIVILNKSRGDYSVLELGHLATYGNSPRQIIQNIWNNPFPTIKGMFQNILLPLSMLLTPTALLPFFSFSSLIPLAIELVVIPFRGLTTGLFPSLAFVYLAAILGIRKIMDTKRIRHFPNLFIGALACLIISLSIVSHYYLFMPIARPPLSKGFNIADYKITKHSLIGHKFLGMIPRDASCIAQFPLAQHLVYQKDLGVFNYPVNSYRKILKERPWQYIFLDVSEIDHLGISRNDYYSEIKRLLIEDDYGVVAYEDGWLLLKASHPKTRNRETLSSLSRYF